MEIDLINKKFNYLLVIEKLEKDDARHQWWLCQCDCGAKTRVQTSDLKNNRYKSCGCRRRIACVKNAKRSGNPIESSWRNLYTRYQGAARTHNREFDIDFHYFRAKCLLPCHYCGIMPKKLYNAYLKTNGSLNKCALKMNMEDVNKFSIYYNGIDRLSSKKGYIRTNCVPCCETCNYLKSAYEYDEFISLIENIFSHTRKYVRKTPSPPR